MDGSRRGIFALLAAEPGILSTVGIQGAEAAGISDLAVDQPKTQGTHAVAPEPEARSAGSVSAKTEDPVIVTQNGSIIGVVAGERPVSRDSDVFDGAIERGSASTIKGGPDPDMPNRDMPDRDIYAHSDTAPQSHVTQGHVSVSGGRDEPGKGSVPAIETASENSDLASLLRLSPAPGGGGGVPRAAESGAELGDVGTKEAYGAAKASMNPATGQMSGDTGLASAPPAPAPIMATSGATATDGAPAAANTPDGQSAAALQSAGMTFSFKTDGALPKAVVDGFAAAGALWSSLLSDTIDVAVEIGFEPLGRNVLGSASTVSYAGDYELIRDAMAADVTSQADAIAVNSLPEDGDIGYLVNHTAEVGGSDLIYIDDDGSSNNRTVQVSAANAKALGFSFPEDHVDASIAFSSTFRWDFDRSDGIDAGGV